MNTTIDTILHASLGGGVLCILKYIHYYRPVWEGGYFAYYNRYNTTVRSGRWGIVHTTIDTILEAGLGGEVLCILQWIQYYRPVWDVGYCAYYNR